ncbi:MAG: phosphatase PAP2 family protein [Ilumatobacteraceae bacterium]
MWLSWRWALGITVVLGLVGTGLRKRPPAVVRGAHQALIDELTRMFLLYTLWRICGRLSVMGLERAMARGEAVWRLERWLHLPNEATLQGWVLGHGLVVQAANVYYAVVHAPAAGIFLAWMFFAHRDRYPAARNAFALTTFACLVIQLVPVAPPRFFPEFGFVDTAASYGQSVYSATLGPESFNQLSAMPSVHVAWAVIVGWFSWRLGVSRWRWLGVAHAVATVWVVTVTANHWLADGLVAAVLFGASWQVARWWEQRPRREPVLAASVVGTGSGETHWAATRGEGR